MQMAAFSSCSCMAIIPATLACWVFRYGADMSGLGAARAQWNASLLRHVAADAYVALLEVAKAHLGPSPAYAALWPSQARLCASA